ncbi:leucine-rich repeat neuronal protein 4 [Cololabis saira]|uniref:leucine-rich repeat neuronal protein 4 n=1 Tax=Cololabis saira TaxID=129043 RepID=UPI002AD4AEB6|nr:leucine-rich repeat neuronal protein 4 [Cololabis saira]
MKAATSLVTLVVLVSLRGSSSLPTTAGVSHWDARVLTDDYDDYDDATTPAAPPRATRDGLPQQCDYSPCREKQTPCEDLATSTGCLCPGITLHDKAPMTPDLRTVSWNGSAVVLHWCAPYSHVTSYIVTVGGEEKKEFKGEQRSGALGEIDHVTKVCVAAVNDAGISEQSCKMYQPSDSKLLLTAGLVGGALGLLLLLLLVVLLWRRRRQRKQEATVSMSSSAGRQ